MSLLDKLIATAGGKLEGRFMAKDFSLCFIWTPIRSLPSAPSGQTCGPSQSVVVLTQVVSPHKGDFRQAGRPAHAATFGILVF